MSKGTILVAGAVAQKPREAGHTWVFLEYLLGFRKLGWDVLFLDELKPDSAQPDSVDYLLSVMRKYGLEDSFSLICDGGKRVIGLPLRDIVERARNAAFLLNVMGYLSHADILAAVPRRIFLDIDPGFGQMWRELGLDDPFAGHDGHITIGQNIGQPGCEIPTCGIPWITTAQPLVLDLWPNDSSGGGDCFTSICAWRGPNGPVEYRGQTYGLRVHEFRRFITLPRISGCRFELALDIHPSEEPDLRLLREHGWSLTDPRTVASTPADYQQYIRQSRGEFLVAKNMYVKTHSGWFSDRSICYLATGRPVVAQNTGLRGMYPSGRGLLLYDTLEEAADAVQRVTRDAPMHRTAARDIAEEFFDSDKVLGQLLNKLGVS